MSSSPDTPSMSTASGGTWAQVHPGGAVSLSYRGQPPVEYAGRDLAQARELLVGHLAECASREGQAITAHVTEPEGEFHISVDADGGVTTPTNQAPPQEADPAPVDQQPAPHPSAQPALAPSETGSDQPQPAQPAGPPQTRRERQSFLTRQQSDEPAAHGWRAALGTVGIRLKPSAAELAQRSDEEAVSQHWPGPRTIAIVNGKGGAGKTPTTILLASVFARYGGAGVLAWDNNQTRGTLGWRTEQGPHEATLHDLLPQVDHLVGTSARSADLAHYVHHQSRDQYDVLRSKPMQLAADQRIDPSDVDAIHQVASKYYRLVFIDSGNDESDPMWLRMIDHADQVVVATTTRDDHAEAGALLLEELTRRGDHGARLAAGAVAVVTQADSHAPRRDAQRIAQGYQALTREVATIGYDPAMVGGHLRYGALAPDTRRAWLHAAAAVARGL